MSRENLFKLLQAAGEDEQLKEKLENAGSYVAVKNVAREQGCDLGDLSEEQANLTLGVLSSLQNSNLGKLFQVAEQDEQLKEKLESARSYDDVKNIAQEKGFDLGDLTAEQAECTIGMATGQITTEELTDEELELVAGGGVPIVLAAGAGFAAAGVVVGAGAALVAFGAVLGIGVDRARRRAKKTQSESQKEDSCHEEVGPDDAQTGPEPEAESPYHF